MQVRAEALPECGRRCCPWRQAESIAESAQHLNNDSLLLASNGTTSRLLHQEEHFLAILVLARVDFLFVGSKVCVVHESGVFAQVTHQRISDNGSSEKGRKASAWSRRPTRGVSTLLDEVHLQCGGLCHVLFVASDAPHHSARANPVRGHEHVLFETIAANGSVGSGGASASSSVPNSFPVIAASPACSSPLSLRQLSLVLRGRSGPFGQPSKSSNGLHEGGSAGFPAPAG